MNNPMKPSGSLKDFGQAIIELFFYLPILLIAAVYLLPSSAIWLWIATLPFCYWGGSLVIAKWASMRLGVKLLQAAALGILHSVLLIGAGIGIEAIWIIAICAFIAALSAARGMSAKSRGWSVTFPNTQMLIGVMLYVAMQPLKLMVFKKLIDYNGVLIVCGIIAVILFFFFANERHLNSETVDTGKTSATHTFKRQNRIMMAVIVIVISVIALFRQIQQMIERFFHSIVERLMIWLSQPEEVQPPAEELPDAAEPQLPAGEAKAPSEWMLLLEQILKIIGIVLLIVVVCVLLYFLAKKLLQWGKLIAAKLQERGADHRNGGAGFTDEVESLMSLTSWREQMGNQLKKLFPKKRSSAQEWSDLRTNAEKIRYLYTRLLRNGSEQGYVIKDYLTPRETADDMAKWKDGSLKQGSLQSFIDEYEKVRYGDKLPDEQQVDTFKQQFDKKGNQAR
ncbi:DUF4129 domain-containing protein [Paenibacillus sp. LHD-38]|uniref:DUF4129 domain-containing protein n=1 Tax=Paenibacillus sp. LHD-38 TaxID=3072143 RepID=UPI00280D525C|nr:DUF4129 domain-containing protein [Paenibacillus sp. LHD-38]MDQ8733700.1 DUF4129 domain-containing protein [Paenibacillus sp. LHD-38]